MFIFGLQIEGTKGELIKATTRSNAVQKGEQCLRKSHPYNEFVLCNFVRILSAYGSLVLLPRLAPSYILPTMVYGSGHKNFTP